MKTKIKLFFLLIFLVSSCNPCSYTSLNCIKKEDFNKEKADTINIRTKYLENFSLYK